MADYQADVLIIGAGPGGYVCAIRAAQKGLKTIIVDTQAPGGTCLNVGCIPSKALIHAAQQFHDISHCNQNTLGIEISGTSLDFSKTLSWKNGIVTRLNHGVAGLFKKSGVTFLLGLAHFVDGKTVTLQSENTEHTINASNIVIATGSKPIELATLPFGGDVISSTDALALSKLPKSLAVVGAGYIGLELGIAFAKLGVKVTIIEASDRILPQYDLALSQPIKKRLKELGLELLLETTALSFHQGALETSQGTVKADKVLVAVGRIPNTRLVGVDELALTMDGEFIKINDACQTSMRGIYAIGDVTGEPMLAHRAMAQGELVAEHLSGNKESWDKLCVPAVCFTDPEIVSCGKLPEDVPGAIVSEFPLAANGRALTLQDDDQSPTGFIRIVARAEDQAVIGIQAVGKDVSELSAGFALAIEMGATLEDLAATIHCHPTQSEGLQEAALKALGRGLHV